MNTVFKRLAAGLIVSAGLTTSAMAAECIAPANPGGGWDFTCRAISKIMTDIGAVDGPGFGCVVQRFGGIQRFAWWRFFSRIWF